LHRKPVSAPLLAAILAGLAMLGPFSIDTYLPSFPAIERDFTITTLQQAEYRAILATSGFTLASITPTASPVSVIEARPS
jgi:DHA1 family bicyclomycin/chloramphenicol resistance-like MFS transporter